MACQGEGKSIRPKEQGNWGASPWGAELKKYPKRAQAKKYMTSATCGQNFEENEKKKQFRKEEGCS